jgi:hypothetical protein
MPQYTFPFDFIESDNSRIEGNVRLDETIPFEDKNNKVGLYRTGRISIEGHSGLDLVLYHNEATSKFMYIRPAPADENLLELIGLSREEIRAINFLTLPGQLCMGSYRSRCIGSAIRNIFAAPTIRSIITGWTQQNLAIFPIAREGLKYQLAEAIFENYGFYCDEIVLDAHHVFDSSVPPYNRKVEMTLFKDKDLNKHEHDNVSIAFIADSIASGLVMKEVMLRVKERFPYIQHLEIISPFATVRGLCRIARSEQPLDFNVRVHVFETLLNALPPDYYYSAHYNIPELHIQPDLEKEYRQWWGQDAHGNFITDTACAGYGWSEIFFSPRKQIQMINGELGSRHNLTIADIVRKNIR